MLNRKFSEELEEANNYLGGKCIPYRYQLRLHLIQFKMSTIGKQITNSSKYAGERETLLHSRQRHKLVHPLWKSV